MRDPDDVESIDDQLKHLRSTISDLGFQVDSSKTTTAAALGGGVFLLLLAAGAIYDLLVNNGGVWLRLGVTRNVLTVAVGALAGIATILLAFGIRRIRRSDVGAEARLKQMEAEYADLLDRRNSVSAKPSS
jgi:hypothetical protein